MNSVLPTTEYVRAIPARRRRRRTIAGLALVVALGASACESNPSALRVAKDLVNTLAESDEQRDCMLEKLDGYGKDEIDAIARASNEVGPGTALDRFEADLASCA